MIPKLLLGPFASTGTLGVSGHAAKGRFVAPLSLRTLTVLHVICPTWSTLRRSLSVLTAITRDE